MNKFASLILCLFSWQAVSAEVEAILGWAELNKFGFAVNGKVIEPVVEVGAVLKKGDVIAQLDQAPFRNKIKFCQSSIDELEPEVFDSKIEYDQAEELFERTVLSEIELQKIEGKHKEAQAKYAQAEARCNIVRWKASQSKLIAKRKSYVITSNVSSGIVVSDENKSDLYFEIASVGYALAKFQLSFEQKSQIKTGDGITVSVDGRDSKGKIQSIAMMPDQSGLYEITAKFDYAQLVEPGKSIKVSY